MNRDKRVINVFKESEGFKDLPIWFKIHFAQECLYSCILIELSLIEV